MNNKIHTSTSFKVLAVIQQVENHMQKPVNKKKFERLLSELNTAQKECEDESLMQEIISLYGRLVQEYNTYLTKEIAKIQTLVNTSSTNSLGLQKKISALKNSDGISRTLADTLSEMEKKLKNPLTPSINPFNIKELLFEEASELFDLAGFVYYDQQESVEKALKNLSANAEKALFKHLASLSSPFLKEKNLTLQALFASAYELSGKPMQAYPTTEEIKTFFKERQLILKKEQTKQKKACLIPFARPA